MAAAGMGGLTLMGTNKVSLRDVEKIVDRLEISPSGNLNVCTSEAVGVAALQIQVKPYSSIAEYIVDMNLYVSDAVNRRAQLICLPGYAGLLPISAIPQSHAHLQRLIPAERYRGGPHVDAQGLNDALSYLSDQIFDAYFYTMSTLAARHGVYIMAGSTLYFEETELCHRAFLFNSEGELAGYQDKLSEDTLESELQIPSDSEVKVFDTPMGAVSILIGSDSYNFECARIAKNLGAKILLCPCAFINEYTPVDSSLGPNMRAQENRVYAVQSSLVGQTGIGFSMEGGGRIYAPNELMRHKNGLAAKTSGRSEPDVACINLNLDRLDEIRNPYTQDTNPEFMRKYVDRLY